MSVLLTTKITRSHSRDTARWRLLTSEHARGSRILAVPRHRETNDTAASSTSGIYNRGEKARRPGTPRTSAVRHAGLLDSLVLRASERASKLSAPTAVLNFRIYSARPGYRSINARRGKDDRSRLLAPEENISPENIISECLSRRRGRGC